MHGEGLPGANAVPRIVQGCSPNGRLLIVVRTRRWPCIVQEESRILRCLDAVERAGPLGKVEEVAKIRTCACIREIQSAKRQAVVVFDKPEDAPEVRADIADVSRRSVGGDHQQRNAKAVLVVPLRLGQDGWGLMVVPTSPIIPCDQDGGVLPTIPRTATATLACSRSPCKRSRRSTLHS